MPKRNIQRASGGYLCLVYHEQSLPYIYLGYEYLGKTVTELGKYLGIMQTAVSKAMAAGRKINEERDILKAVST
ncbi:MAG: hypothetical protein ABH952_04640 [Candidatus Omnitrophota bacterium]